MKEITMSKKGDTGPVFWIIVAGIIAIIFLIAHFVGPQQIYNKLVGVIKGVGEKTSKILPSLSFDDLTEQQKSEAEKSTGGRKELLEKILERARELRKQGILSSLIDSLTRYKDYITKADSDLYKNERVESVYTRVKEELQQLQQELCHRLLEQGNYARDKGAISEATAFYKQAKDIGCDIGQSLAAISTIEDKKTKQEREAQALFAQKNYDGAITIYRDLLAQFSGEGEAAVTLRLHEDVNIGTVLWEKDKIAAYNYFDTILSKYGKYSFLPSNNPDLQEAITRLHEAANTDANYKKIDFAEVKAHLELRNVRVVQGFFSHTYYTWTTAPCDVSVLSGKDVRCSFTYSTDLGSLQPVPSSAKGLTIDRGQPWQLDYTFTDLAGTVLCSGKAEDTRYGDAGVVVFVDLEKNCGLPQNREYIKRIEVRTLQENDAEWMQFTVKRHYD